VTKNQYELCVEILRRLGGSGVLDGLVLIGSWCVPFYENYFGKSPVVLKTRDLDFLVPRPERISAVTDVPKLLEDLGFVVEYDTSQGHMRLMHPELIVEFLVPEKGKETRSPFPLPKLGLNAQPLRFLNILCANTLCVKIGDVAVTLPHPVNFTLHKLIISGRRGRADKAVKDADTALRLLEALLHRGDEDIVRSTFLSFAPGWRREVLKTLRQSREELLEHREVADRVLSLLSR
jgi:hypothetical protein